MGSKYKNDEPNTNQAATKVNHHHLIDMVISSTENVGVYTNPKHELYPELCQMPGEPGPDEVTLNVVACGICGSDVHFQKEGAIGDNVISTDIILGHEAAGIVKKVGKNVTNVKVGDRVSIEPGKSCGKCQFCISGHYNGCPEMEFKSTPPFDGLLRRFVNHPARLCYPIGDLSFEEGALIEPFSVSLAGVDHSKLKIGDPTVVCGAGPIGIIAALIARASGASPLAITDLNEDRLKLAEKIVPGIRTVRVDKDKNAEEMGQKIIDTLGTKARVALECTGMEPSIAAAIYSLQFRGVCEIIGVGKNEIKIPFMHFSFNEMTINGLFRYTNTWPRAIRMIQDGVVDVKPLVSFKYSYEDAAEAFKKSADPKSTGIKTMIFMNDDFKK